MPVPIRRPFAVLVAVLAVLACAGPAAAKPRAAKGLPEGAVSITPIRPVVTPAAFGRQVAIAKRAGASIVRTEIEWRYVEPVAPGQTDQAFMALVDRSFAEAARRGIKVLLTVDGTPCWASVAPPEVKGDCSTEQQRSDAAAYQPADPTTFAPMVAGLAGRYAKQLAGIELWNEPDHENLYYWNGPDKAVNYAALTRAAYPAIKAVAPRVRVLAGSLVGADGAFLNALYAAGFKGSYDILSVHYYDLVLASIRQIRDFQNKAGDRTPIWLNEFGWTSCLNRTTTTQGGHQCVDAKTQARNTRDVVRAMKGTSYIEGVTLYTAVDSPSLSFGLVDLRGKDKPVVKAYRDALTRRGPVSRLTLSLRRRNGQLVASGRGPAGDAYRLELYRDSDEKLLYEATFTLDRHDRYSLKLPPQLGTRGVRVHVYQFWLGGGENKTV